jgi:predicted benzoate:H+ symporter BenE
MALEALSSHICIEAVSHELVDKAANIGFILFASALKIVKITKALTMLVAGVSNNS